MDRFRNWICPKLYHPGGPRAIPESWGEWYAPALRSPWTPREVVLPKRILVVDDEPAIVRILTRRLVHEGYVVLSAANGAETMAKLTGFRPDAILMDVMMPGQDGVQIAERLGKLPATARTPVIFISALIGPDQPEDSPTNPLHHYLGKPFEPEALLGLLKRIGV